jgi:small-conductance mechanosensitive channel
MRFRYALVLSLFLVSSNSFTQDSGNTADAQTLIGFLNESLRWYRDDAQASQVTDPEDRMFVSAGRQLARDYLRSAFDYARAQAPLLDVGNPTLGTTTRALSPTLQQSFNQISSQLAESQRALATVEEQLANGSGPMRRVLEAQRNELKSEIALAQARIEILQTFMNYRQAADNGSRGKQSLAAQIEELEQTVPELRASASGKDPQPAKIDTADKSASVSTPQNGDDQGLLGAISALFTLKEKLSAVNGQIRSTSELRDDSRKLMAPLRSALSDAAQRGSSISAGAPVNDIAVLKQQKTELDTLTQKVKETSAIALPLGRAGLLLDSYRSNLGEWRKQLEQRASSRLRYVALRLAILAAVIGVILLLSSAWRRATLKYVVDVRRQNQILLVRRIVVAILILFVLAITLMSEVGALATYAGLVTAGLAVALQNIILSVIAYFFLIGRYGVHIGDRVTISGITGKVSEIGLLRFHLLELQGEETDLHLSGRVVVFSNAVILQPTSHFFKQAPAADFLWHEMKLTCEPNSDYWELERRLRTSLENIYMNHTMAGDDHGFTPSGKLPSPVVKVMIGQGGVIIVVRYPIYAYGSSDLDERVTRAVLSITHRTKGVELSTQESLQTESSSVT